MSETRGQQLKVQQDKLKQNQDAIAGLQQQNAGIQARIKVLETYQAEVQRATAGYPKGTADALQSDLTGVKTVMDNKRKTAELRLGNLKEALDTAIKDFQSSLDVQNKTATDAADKAKKAAADNDAAVQTVGERQADYAALQNLPKTLDSSLRDLKALLDRVTTTEAADDFVAMYFYLGEAEARAGGIKIPTPDEYTDQLAGAQSAIDQASDDAGKAKADLDAATAAAADAQKKYAVALTARQANLLDALRKVPPPAPAN
jgi:hypothetical protein